MSARTIGYGITTTLAVVAFVGSGLANLTRTDHIAHDMAHLGYPTYFMTLLGTWKVLGAIAIAAPRLARVKEWAYAGMFFDLTGAAASRAASLDPAETIVVPLVIASMVIASWALRPESRRLGTSRASAEVV